MSVENTPKYPSLFYSVQTPKGFAELNGLRSAFINSIQEQQQKQEYERKEKPQQPAEEVPSENVSRNEYLRREKKTLNQSEVRSEQLENDYTKKLERKETLQKENKQEIPIVRSEDFRQNAEHFYSDPLYTKNDAPVISSIHSSSTASVNFSAPPATGSSPVSLAPAAVPLSAETVTVSTSVVGMIPQSVSPAPVSVPVSAASVFTVFTAAGQLRKIQEEKEEKKDEEKNGKKKEKKGTFTTLLQPFVQKSAAASGRTPRTTSSFSLTKTPQETFAESAEEAKKTPRQNKETAKDIPFEELLERLEKPVPFNETVNPQTETSSSQTQEHIDRVQFVQRIAAACQSAVNQNGTVRMKLNLGELGGITLWATTKDKKLSVRFETQRNQTRQLLSENIDGLRTSLAEQGILLEKVEWITLFPSAEGNER